MVQALDVLQERGFVSQITDEAAVRELLAKPPVTCYIGFDPTADSLHAGSLVPLMALAHIQRSGHRPIAIIGGGTAMIGDPSGKTELRQMLTAEQIAANAVAITRQVGRYIDLSDGGGIALNNTDWLAPLNYIEFLRDIGRNFSVNRMLTFEAYRKRLESESGLSFIEFNYQLLQAYDFLVLFREHGCVMQMGGDDQWGNICAGIDLIRRLEGASAVGVTFPLLTTSTGEKMGKTAQGALWLDADRTSPYEYFQYWRNVDDRDVERFLALFTFLPMNEVRRLGSLASDSQNVRDEGINEAKRVLAYEATRITHGQEAADAARDAAAAAFGGGGKVDAMPSTEIARDRLTTGIPLADLFSEVGLTQSKSEARRLCAQGGAYVNEERVADGEMLVTVDAVREGAILLRAGKKKHHRIIVG